MERRMKPAEGPAFPLALSHFVGLTQRTRMSSLSLRMSPCLRVPDGKVFFASECIRYDAGHGSAFRIPTAYSAMVLHNDILSNCKSRKSLSLLLARANRP